MRGAAPTAVFVPFGLANPDHTATHDAARIVRERFEDPAWFCYQDMGYQHIPGLLAWRVVAAVPSRASGPPRLPRRWTTATPRSRPRSATTSRSSGPSTPTGSSAPKLAAPAPEQFWSLAPPPPGWERLSLAG